VATFSVSVVGDQSEGAWIEEGFFGLIRFDPVISDVLDIAIVPIKHA
jgi:hypothetical protein